MNDYDTLDQFTHSTVSSSCYQALIMSQSILAGYIPQATFFEGVNPGHPGNFFTKSFFHHLQKFSMYQCKFLQMIVIFPESPQTVPWGGSES